VKLSLDEAVQACHKVSLEGLPPAEPWSALLRIADLRIGVTVADRGVTATSDITINSSFDFEFAISEAEWQGFCADRIERGHTSAQALVATSGSDRIHGSRVVWARNAAALDRLVDALRESERAGRQARPTQPEPTAPPAGWSPIRGSYLHVEIAGTVHRVYVERAGTGTPLLCLHTAGADSRQFRYLLEDPELTARHEVIAFDMPWHGQSAPPDDWRDQTYRLTTERYAETILAVMDAVELDRPILIGCSMGGAIALYMASQHGERFTGVCALEAGLGNPGRFVEWSNRSDVDHSNFLTSWVGGLMAPSSPAGPRAQTLWGYAQSGPGVYQGDTYFYSQDFPRHRDKLGRATCPLHVFSGEYDYSATTDMSREAVEVLGGTLIEMVGKGHFPMSEDPESFAEYLYPVLAELRDGSSEPGADNDE
jgi:pimeloyl-ACP methyl ester carboxylesterase